MKSGLVPQGEGHKVMVQEGRQVSGEGDFVCKRLAKKGGGTDCNQPTRPLY